MYTPVRAIALTLLLAFAASSKTPPIPVKVVVVAMFERGADTGDQPGELQYWVERNHLDREIPFPQGYHPLRMNKDGVLAVLTGVGTAKSTAAIMALGMDPRFDLTKAYWIVAGISGINPCAAASVRRRGRSGWWMVTWRVKSTVVRFPRGGRQAIFPCVGRFPMSSLWMRAKARLITWSLESSTGHTNLRKIWRWPMPRG